MSEVRVEGNPTISPEEHSGIRLGFCGPSLAMYDLLRAVLSAALDEERAEAGDGEAAAGKRHYEGRCGVSGSERRGTGK